MAITIIQYPVKNDSSYTPRLHPVGNGMVYIVDSDNKTKTDFNYVAKIVHSDGSYTTLRSIPNATTGYGFFQVEKILKNYVSSQPYFENTTGVHVYDEFFYPYTIEFFESYNEEWEFYDNFYYSADGTVGFTATTKHNFSIGQLINIVQDEPYTNEEYNGYHTITNIPDDYSIVTDQAWGVNTGAEGGTITDAYSRALINYNESAVTDTSIAINSIFKPSEFLDWNTKKNSITGTITISEAAFLTTAYDKSLNIRTTNQCELIINLNQSNSQNSALINVFAVALPGQTLSSSNYYFTGDTTNEDKVVKVKCGPANLTGADVSGNTIDWTKVDYYAVHLCSSDKTIRTQLFKNVFKVDHSCSVRYDNIELLYEDRYGSYLPFNLNMSSTENLNNINRTTYLQKIGGWNGTNYTYNTYDKGNTIFNIDKERIYVGNSDYINETNAGILEDMFISKNVYAKLDDNWYSIIILDTTYEKKKRKSGELISYQITFKISNNE